MNSACKAPYVSIWKETCSFGDSPPVGPESMSPYLKEGALTVKQEEELVPRFVVCQRAWETSVESQVMTMLLLASYFYLYFLGRCSHLEGI